MTYMDDFLSFTGLENEVVWKLWQLSSNLGVNLQFFLKTIPANCASGIDHMSDRTCYCRMRFSV
jgi:hypothetical protein